MARLSDRIVGNPLNIPPNFNAIINGDFDIWQRGTSQTAAGYGSADRWTVGLVGSGVTFNQQTFTLGQTAVPDNPVYYSKAEVASNAGAGNYTSIEQRIEGVQTFAGTTATLSFWAKTDTAKNMAVEFLQNFGTGGSPSTEVTGINVTTIALTTAWTKYFFNVTVPSITGKTLGSGGNDSLSLIFWLEAGSTYNARTNSLGQQGGVFEISHVQLEAGEIASPFEYRSVGQELDLCQRYCYVIKNEQGSASTIAPSITTGLCYNTTLSYYVMSLPVTMRGIPSIVVSSSSHFQQIDTSVRNLTNVTLGNATLSVVSLNGTGSGMTAGRGALLRFSSIGGYDKYIHVNAEL